MPLPYVYARYNFMPLARGTAASGYTALLALFWAADMPVTATIPPNYQVGALWLQSWARRVCVTINSVVFIDLCGVC